MLIHDLRCVTVSQGDLVVSALITAGVSNAIAAGISPPVPSSPGTINLILIIDAALAPGALVNLVITATEAKTAMLQAMGLLLPTGEPITGTSTDALAIACTERGARWEYGVPITPVGALVVAWRRRWFMSERCRILLLALLIDALWGDPPNRYHPVAWMGRGIAWLRRHAPRQGNARLLAFGACISPGGALVVGSLGALSDQGLRWLPDPVSVLIEALALKSTFATRHCGRRSARA